MTTEATDTNTDAAPTEQTRAVTVVRERLIAEAPMAMFDSAAFEHLQRVATVIYRSGFAPRSLTHEGTGDNAVELPESMVVARMVLLADQANRSGADVIGYIQATSVINGRLMYEGKLVNAIVQRRLGIRLKYRFGLWDTDHIVLPELVTDEADPRFGEPVDPTFFHGAGERLAVRAFNPGSPDEAVEGSVGQWKTTRSGNPWTKPADWPRQLRYRAVREWARAYDPGTVLGMIADGDEEVDTVHMVQQQTGPGVMARLSGHQNGEGFDPDNGHAHTTEGHEGVKGKRAARKKAAEALPAPEAESPATPAAEDLPSVLDEPEVQELVRPQPEPSTATASSEPTSEPEPTTTTDASTDTSPTESQSEAEVITEGYPAENEIYMLNGDDWEHDESRGEDRRDTYKNGEPFSDAGRDKGYHIYEDHAPERTIIEQQIEAGIDLVEDEAEEELPADFAAYADAIDTVNSWPEVKAALKTFMEGPTWKSLTEAQRNKQRATTWSALTEREVEWLPSPTTDLSAYRLFVEASDNPQPTFDALTETAAFTGAPDATRSALIGATAARIDSLKG